MSQALMAGWRIFRRLCPFVLSMYLVFQWPAAMLDDWNPPHEGLFVVLLVVVYVLLIWPLLFFALSRLTGDMVVPAARMHGPLTQQMRTTELQWLKAAQKQIQRRIEDLEVKVLPAGADLGEPHRDGSIG